MDIYELPGGFTPAKADHPGALLFNLTPRYHGGCLVWRLNAIATRHSGLLHSEIFFVMLLLYSWISH